MKPLVAALLVIAFVPRVEPPVSAETFARLAERERQFLIESAAAASVKAERADVKLLAQQLLGVYLSERALFENAAAADGVIAGEPRLAEAQQQDLGVLIATSGSAFDDAFLDQQRNGLERSLALCHSFSAGSRPSRLEAFAKSQASEIDTSLSHLRGLSATASLPLG